MSQKFCRKNKERATKVAKWVCDCIVGNDSQNPVEPRINFDCLLLKASV